MFKQYVFQHCLWASCSKSAWDIVKWDRKQLKKLGPHVYDINWRPLQILLNVFYTKSERKRVKIVLTSKHSLSRSTYRNIDLCNWSWWNWSSVLLFSKLNTICIGCFDPEKIYEDNENKYFWGDLTDISALEPNAGHPYVPPGQR